LIFSFAMLQYKYTETRIEQFFLHKLNKEVSMKDDFEDIYESMTWEMFKMSGGNPLLMQEIVAERNAKREKEIEDSRTL